MKNGRVQSREIPHKPSVLTAPANGAQKVSMSRIKEMVLGAFCGPGGPKLVFEVAMSKCFLLPRSPII